jgi:hypothetical protein
MSEGPEHPIRQIVNFLNLKNRGICYLRIFQNQKVSLVIPFEEFEIKFHGLLACQDGAKVVVDIFCLLI